MINGVALEEAPHSVHQLYSQCAGMREAARTMVEKRREIVGAARSLYLTIREFAITHNHDSKVDIIGTDNLVNNVVLIIKNTASGSTLLSHVDRLTASDLDTMTSALTGQTYTCSSRLQLSLIGSFQDSKNVSQSLLIPILGTLQSSSHYFELSHFCVGESVTVVREGVPLPLLSGVGLNVKTGEIFPAVFSEKGPDMDLRVARTLTGGEKVGMLEVYDCVQEELVIGPFTYSPMRAVDIWLQQSDQFLLQSLSPCPEAVEDPKTFISQLRATLRVIKEHPYPSVTLFQSNNSRTYRKDSNTGMWISRNNTSIITSTTAPTSWYPQQYIKTEAPSISYKADTALTYKTDPAFNLNFHFKHEAVPWQSMQLQQAAYY